MYSLTILNHRRLQFLKDWLDVNPYTQKNKEQIILFGTKWRTKNTELFQGYRLWIEEKAASFGCILSEKRVLLKKQKRQLFCAIMSTHNSQQMVKASVLFKTCFTILTGSLDGSAFFHLLWHINFVTPSNDFTQHFIYMPQLDSYTIHFY